jgi:hypothetical protein
MKDNKIITSLKAIAELLIMGLVASTVFILVLAYFMAAI